MTVPRLVKNLQVPYGTRRLITLFKITRQFSLSRATWIQTAPSHSIRCILILFSHPHHRCDTVISIKKFYKTCLSSLVNQFIIWVLTPTHTHTRARAHARTQTIIDATQKETVIGQQQQQQQQQQHSFETLICQRHQTILRLFFFFQCCHGKHTVASSRTLLSDHVCKYLTL